MANDNYIHKTDFTPKSYSESSTTDISASETYSCCVLVGVYYQKPSSSGLTVTVTNPSGLVARSVDITSLDALTDGYRSLLWPILEGSTIAVATSGSVSGAKLVDLVFLPNRGGAV